MLKIKWKQNLQLFSLYLLAFDISMPYIFSSIGIIITSIIFLFTTDYRELGNQLKRRKWLWLWLLFFLLHLYSYTYSANKNESLFDLKVKLPLLLFPVIIGAAFKLTKRAIEITFLSFVSGVSLLGLFCIGRALYLWKQAGNIELFFYHTLVDGIDANAVYIAWYTFFSLSILLFHTWEYVLPKYQKAIRALLIVLNTTFFILLSSKTLIVLFLVVVVPLYLYRILVGNRLSYFQIGIIALAFTLLATALVTVDNPIRRRYQDIMTNDIGNAFTRDYQCVKQSEFNNLTLRIFLWRLGLENVRDCNLWLRGCGIGDVKDIQFMKMVDYEVEYILSDQSNYRPIFAKVHLHNMYMQSLVMLGLPGLILILMIALAPFYLVYKMEYTYVFLPFFLASFFFMMQESTLQTQAGAIFYTLFSCLFFNIYYTQKKID